MRTASSRRTATSKRPDLPKGVPEDLPGCSWVGNRAGEAALVLPGGETTPWFVREAERQAVEAARAYLAERPHLVEHREAASSVARASWVARALPQAGWELYERGTAQIRVATDDAGLVAAAQLLQPGTCLSVIELCDALQSSGAAHLVIEGIAPEAQGMAWTETDLPADLHAQILAAGYRHVAATREGDSWRHLIVHTADPVQAR
ncbi:MAG TPA: hypothetical protein VFS21_36995, partial [Roseiflexaceae bacterium]|nr:hypothetical protein [Roseiflexaceae bacterium]